MCHCQCQDTGTAVLTSVAVCIHVPSISCVLGINEKGFEIPHDDVHSGKRCCLRHLTTGGIREREGGEKREKDCWDTPSSGSLGTKQSREYSHVGKQVNIHKCSIIQVNKAVGY